MIIVKQYWKIFFLLFFVLQFAVAPVLVEAVSHFSLELPDGTAAEERERQVEQELREREESLELERRREIPQEVEPVREREVPPASAIEAGILPINVFYFLDRFGEWLRLNVFTFSQIKKAELLIRYAEERLAESQALVRKRASASLIIATQERYDRLLGRTQATLERIPPGPEREALAGRLTAALDRQRGTLVDLREDVREEPELEAVENALERSEQERVKIGEPATGGFIINYSLFSSSLQKQMGGIILVPKNYYAQPTQRFPVLYVLPGLSQPPSDVESSLNIKSFVGQYGFVAVIPENGDRCFGTEGSDTSGCIGGWHINWNNPNSPIAPSNPALFEDYIIKDVIPYAEKNYRIRTDTKGRGIIGFSMGGYGAFKYGMKYKTFAFMGSHSGQLQSCSATSPENNPDMCGLKGSLRQKLNDLWELARGCTNNACGVIYLDTVFSDPNYAMTNKYKEHLTALKVIHTYQPSAGGHDNAFWATRLPRSIALFADSIIAPTSALKIIAPQGGGIYLGSFSDLGLYFQLAGDYDASALPPNEQLQYYSQNLDQMYGKKVVIRGGGLDVAFVQDEGIVTEGGKPGRLTFDLAARKRAWEQYGYAVRYGLGDENSPTVFTEIKNGFWDTKIDVLAQSIKSYPYPFFFNYWIEADTAGLHGVAADFKAAIRRIHDRVEAITPNKVTWVAPTIIVSGTAQYDEASGMPLYQLFYPGDQYVDWHGFSFFCWSSEDVPGPTQYLPPKQCLNNMRLYLQGLGKKPVMFEQFGIQRAGRFSVMTDQDREQWYKDFLNEIKNYPEVATILWTQADDTTWNSALKVNEPAVKVIRDEIAANPNYWHSVLQTR